MAPIHAGIGLSSPRLASEAARVAFKWVGDASDGLSIARKVLQIAGEFARLATNRWAFVNVVMFVAPDPGSVALDRVFITLEISGIERS